MGQWSEQVAVITGASSGIGAGLARHAAGLGMHVIAADVDEQGLAALQQEADDRKQSMVTMPIDVADPGAVEHLAQTAFARHGQVNLLFNNAGVLVDGKSWERSVADWQWVLNVNILGVINGIRSFVPRMLAQQSPGRVINTSSIGGLLGGSAYMALYQGSKHAVTTITECLYCELLAEEAPVTASVLCPAEVATGIWESDRLRPVEQHNKLGSEAERQFHDMVAGGVARGLAPDDFASRVFAGIEADRFWLLPQPEFKPLFEVRADAVINEVSPPYGMGDYDQ